MKTINKLLTLEIVILIASFLFAFVLTTCLYAQELETGTMSGISNYKGDLTQGTVLQIQSTKMVNGIFFRYNTVNKTNWKFSIAYGEIAGNDKFNKKENLRMRNLHFKSHILEYALQGEYNFLKKLNPKNFMNTKNKSKNFNCYGFAGIGMMFFKPKAEYNGIWYELQSLGTEGQGTYIKETNKYAAKHYALFQLAIPFGLGMTYYISNKVKIGFETGYRKIFTDYLDDVSGNYADTRMIEEANGKVAAALSNRTTEISDVPVNLPGQPRGNSKTKDSYIFTTLQISVLIAKIQ